MGVGILMVRQNDSHSKNVWWVGRFVLEGYINARIGRAVDWYDRRLKRLAVL